MHQWHFLIVAFFAVLQPIVSFTERNSVDGRRQCCEERDNSLLGDEIRSLHGSNRITQEIRQLKERDIRYAREHRVSRFIADDRVNRMFTRVEGRLSRSDPQVNDIHRRERVGLNREERNRESLRTRAFLQHSRVLRQNNQQDSYRKLSRENAVLEQIYNRREMRRSPGISRVIENIRKVRESRNSIANIRNDLALQSDRRMSKITVNEIRREVEPITNIILRDRQFINARDRKNVMPSSKLERNLENDHDTREREEKSSRVDNRPQNIYHRSEVRLSRQIRTFKDYRQESRMSRENERDQMSRESQRNYIRISRDIRPEIRVRDTRRDTRNSRSLDVSINRNDESRKQSSRNIHRSNDFKVRQTENRNVREETAASRDERRMKDTRFRDIPNQKMRDVRWTEKRSDVTETRITRNRGVEREFVDSRVQNERSFWSRANNVKQLTEDKPVYTWQYLLYSLQTVYLGFLIIKMLSNGGSNKIKNRHFWWESSQKLLKVD